MTESNTERPRMSAHLWLITLIAWVMVAVLAGAAVWAWFVGSLVLAVGMTIVLLQPKWYRRLARWYIKVRGL